MDWLQSRALGLGLALAAGVGFIFAAHLISRWNGRRGRILIDAIDGRTIAGGGMKLLALLCLGFASLVLIAGVAQFPKSAQSLSFWALLIVFGGVGVWLWAMSSHRWEWDSEHFRWIGLFRTRQFSWADIVATGRDWSGHYFYVRSHSGERIWWGDYAQYWTIIEDAVRTARPDLYGLFHAPGLRNSTDRS